MCDHLLLFDVNLMVTCEGSNGLIRARPRIIEVGFPVNRFCLLGVDIDCANDESGAFGFGELFSEIFEKFVEE